jgi:hypothetical protein
MANDYLGAARTAKNDEFYTQYHDIENEINAYLDYDKDVFRDKTVLLPCDDPEWSNFTKFFAQKFQTLGLKKLISTSYAANSKPPEVPYQPTLFEMNDDKFDEIKTLSNGKIFTLTRDKTGDGVINVEDLEWTYLKGDGDFRSEEIIKLRDEADIIVTNPPFSLFREFLTWIVDAEKDFVLIGNMNAITYKEVFPLIKENRMWLGANAGGASMSFILNDNSPDKSGQKTIEGVKLQQFGNICWFTNVDHGRRHQPMKLMSMEDNIRFNTKLAPPGYLKYDNYDAIEVPFSKAIPSDYQGIMGVPITFLSKHNPDQFEILGITKTWDDNSGLKTKIYGQQVQISDGARKSPVSKLNDGAAIEVQESPSGTYYEVDGLSYIQVYARILIRRKKAIK